MKHAGLHTGATPKGPPPPASPRPPPSSLKVKVEPPPLEGAALRTVLLRLCTLCRTGTRRAVARGSSVAPLVKGDLGSSGASAHCPWWRLSSLPLVAPQLNAPGGASAHCPWWRISALSLVAPQLAALASWDGLSQAPGCATLSGKLSRPRPNGRRPSAARPCQGAAEVRPVR